MIKKIVSGGQTGADQAALDAAIRWDIPHGGWVPKGRKTEHGPLPDKYTLKEMPTDSYPDRTEQNAIDSDGTLIISHGELTGGSEYTQEMAMKHERPCLHIDRATVDSFHAAKKIYSWIKDYTIETLNVAGSKASKDPYIYQAVMKTLVTVFHMELIETTMPDPRRATPFMPETLEQALDILISDLPLKSKSAIANLDQEELVYLHPSLSEYVRNKFGLWFRNNSLLESCLLFVDEDEVNEDDAPAIIIKELWKKLRKSHALRVVK
jgi:hypothetical protein